MGFSLESFFNQLIALLEAEQKPQKTIKQLKQIVAENKQYAKECGQLK